MNKKGFTLIELVVVIVILAIILLISIPKISSAITNSRKKTFLSSLKMIQDGIKTDSLLFKSSSYTLDSNGILKRVNGDEEVQVDYKGKLYSKNKAVISIGNNNTITLVSGEICDASKKYCIGSGTTCNISSISMKSLTLNDINLYSEENYDDVLDEGDITKVGTTGSVTYRYCSNGTIVVDGTGDGQMKSEMSLFYNILRKYFNTQVSQKTGISIDDFTDLSEYFTYYMNGYTKISDFSEWGEEIHNIFSNIFINNGNYTNNLNTFINLYDTLNITMPQIKRVVVNNGVKTISGYAFYPGDENQQNWDNNLYTININEIYLSETVETIGAYAFSNSSQEGNNIGNNSINDLIIPNGVTSIGNYAFGKCGIETLTLGTGLNIINSSAFKYNSIENLIIPGNIETIGPLAFANNELKSITFNHGIQGIEHHAFLDNKLTSVEIPDSIEYISSAAFMENRILSGQAIVHKDPTTEHINQNNLQHLQVFLSNGANGDEDILATLIP